MPGARHSALALVPGAIFAVVFLMAVPALAADASFVPHYASQRAGRANLREGPGYHHRILWVYRHRGYPFRVTAKFDIWRRVQDVNGTIGWMSAALLSNKRTVLVTGKRRVRIYQDANGGRVVGLADPGAIADLETCTRDACQIHDDDIDGWIARNRIWGVGKDETFK
jgi:SH3-like domain-containing protein